MPAERARIKSGFLFCKVPSFPLIWVWIETNIFQDEEKGQLMIKLLIRTFIRTVVFLSFLINQISSHFFTQWINKRNVTNEHFYQTLCVWSHKASLLRKSFNTHNEAMKHEFYLEFDMDCRLFTHNSDIDISEHVLVQHTVFKTRKWVQNNNTHTHCWNLA